MSKTKVPALKNIPSTVERELRDTLVSMKEAQEIRLGRIGDPLDRAVTLRELVDSGMAKQLTERSFNPDGLIDFIPNEDSIGDLSIPPAPTGLEASGAFTEVIVTWNTAQYSNHSYTEVWRSRDDEVGTATLITTTSSFIVTDPVGYDQTYFYWVRFVSTSNVRGPFNRTNGTKATTVENIAEVMGQLSETLADLPGYNLITTTAAAATVIRSSGSPSTRADGSALQLNDIWYDTDDGQIYTRNAANNAWVAGRDATLVTLFGSTSFTGSTLTAAMATAQSDIVTVTNAQNSTASSVTSLTSTVGTNTSSINTLNTTTASHTGDLNAMFVLTVATESDSSKSAAGMVIGSNASNGSGAQSYVQFQADKFVIWNGNNASTAPFIVSSNTVFIKDAMIQSAAINTARIANLAVEEAKIGNLAVTAAKIANATITTAKIGNAQITNALINDLDAGKINAGFISADRINSNTITADKINVTDLVLPTSGGLVSGSTIGNFNTNSLRYAHVTSVGTGAGFYQGYVRLVGGTGEVKTISMLFSDGTFGASASNQINTTVTSGGTDTTKLTDNASSPFRYVTPTLDKLPGLINESRLTSSSDTTNIPFAFRYTGTGTVNLFIYAQGNSNSLQIGSADARFVKFSAS
tara:strand:- start:741 stop:2657 length:1917 start_codon:yes stop_codon:yes gene_type:complete